jgi:hypothetical protein
MLIGFRRKCRRRTCGLPGGGKHQNKTSTLTLLVARVLANDANDALATNHLAIFADTFNTGTDFHFRFS